MNQNLRVRRFAKDGIYNLSRQIASVGVGMLTSILIARSLGVEGRGSYAIALLFSAMLLTLFNAGLQTAITYQIAQNRDNFRQIARKSGGLSVWAIIAILSIGLVVILLLRQALFPKIPANFLLISLLIIPPALYGDNLIAVFRGIEDFRTSNLIELASPLAIFILVVLLVWVLDWGVSGALLAMILGRSVGLLVGTILLRRYLRTWLLLTLRIDWTFTRFVLSYGSRTQLARLGALLNYRADIFLLNLFVGPASVGLYAVAVGLAERLWMPSQALGAVMFPRVISLEGDENARSQLTTLIVRHVLWASISMALIAFVLAEWGIVLLYGEAFRESAQALKLLLPGIVALGTARMLATDLAGRGRPGLNAAHSIIAASVNIFLNLLLIPSLGFTGAAIATSFSYTLLMLIKFFVFQRLMQIGWRELWLPNRTDFRRWRWAFSWVMSRLDPRRRRKRNHE